MTHSDCEEIKDELLHALEAVETWWINEEMPHRTGAPVCIFMVRAVLAKAQGES